MDRLTEGLLTADDEVLLIYDRTAPELYRYATRLTDDDRQQTQDLVQGAYVRSSLRGRPPPRVTSSQVGQEGADTSNVTGFGVLSAGPTV